jgi:hypothetical protein
LTDILCLGVEGEVAYVNRHGPERRNYEPDPPKALKEVVSLLERNL